MNDYLKTIKLGFGKGKRGEQGCWMRVFHIADTVIREWTPTVLRNYWHGLRIGCPMHLLYQKIADKLEEMPKISKETSKLYRVLDTLNEMEIKELKSAKTIIMAACFLSIKHSRIMCDGIADSVVGTFPWPWLELNADRDHRKYLKTKVYPLLRELIEMGPHAPKESEYPACGVQKFKEAVGIV